VNDTIVHKNFCSFAKMAMHDLQRYPLKLWLIKYSDLRISTAGKHMRILSIKYFKAYKNNDIFHIIYQIKVSRVPCEASITIWPCRVTKINVYSLMIVKSSFQLLTIFHWNKTCLEALTNPKNLLSQVLHPSTLSQHTTPYTRSHPF